MRIRLKKSSDELSEKIVVISTRENERSYDEIKDVVCKENEVSFVDIVTDLENRFDGHIISASQEEKFIRYYTDFFKEAHLLTKNLRSFVLNRQRLSPN